MWGFNTLRNFKLISTTWKLWGLLFFLSAEFVVVIAVLLTYIPAAAPWMCVSWQGGVLMGVVICLLAGKLP